MGEARSLDLSRRVTIERLGETLDYYIEGISLAQPGFTRMEYLLSPVPGVTVPSAPVVTVTAVTGETMQVAVSWSKPYNGGVLITDYDVRYKKSTDTDWISWPHTGAARTATITGLEQGGTFYDVQVRAGNSLGESSWSASGTGSTSITEPYEPAAPTLTGQPGSLAVAWSAPYNGGASITDYDVRYKKSTATDWTDWLHTGTARTATITGLDRSGGLIRRASAGAQ